jgi:hypothetical protein
MKYYIGKNNRGVKEYLDDLQLQEIYRFPRNFNDKFTNQQWAKIRKMIKKEFMQSGDF